MLYNLLYPLASDVSLFNVFKYITFRTFGASITAVLLCLIAGPSYIRYLQQRQMGQVIRELGPQSHLSKKGTPTMGGGLIILCIAIATVFWADITNPMIWVCLVTTFLYGLIGYLDDYLKVVRKNSKGLSAKQKLIGQVVVAAGVGYYLYASGHVSPTLKFPFFKGAEIYLGWLYIPFVVLVIVGTSNAVNLTDGLDGLAVGPTIITAVTFSILAYVAGNFKIAEYLQIPYVAMSGELAVFGGVVAASCLGFLWYNTYPAQVFMGDVGSLSLGGALGAMAVITKNELLLVLCGGVFVVEALSVITQVASFKMTGKRVFKMAPIHHHFELKGWAEPKVIVRFWIISILLALLTLSTLKLR